LAKIFIIDPARADQCPIDVVLDHPFERPGLRPLLQIERGVEIETVFAFKMRANEGGIGNALGLVDDIGQLSLRGGRRRRPLLAIGKTGHLQLDFGLGHERADFRQAEAGAKAVEGNHVRAPGFLNRCFRLAIPCCHHGVSSGHISRETSPLPGAIHDVSSQRRQLPPRKGLQSGECVQRQRGDRPAEVPGSAVDGNQMRHGPSLGTPERPKISEAIKNHHDKILFVGVLSRYTGHLLPTWCQHRRATLKKREPP
jgi:hypothetical protein